VRLDGQMSSKRRQETIAQFSVPFEDNFPDKPGDDTPAMDTSDEEFPGNMDNNHLLGNGKKSTRSKFKGKGKASTNPKVFLLSLKAVRFRCLGYFLGQNVIANL
jgi:SWI/SNF-related matrix-associated actin-dependent regulator of chromatin subfamily A3